MSEEAKPTAKPEGFITAKEAERRYGLSGSYLIRMHKEGKFAADQIGPVWLLHEASLDAWYKTRKKRGGFQGRKPKKQESENADPEPPRQAMQVSYA